MAVSGGVDSSVAALLARDRVGAENVVGMYMRNWDGADEAGETLQCSTAADLRSARDVCSELGIAFQCMDFEKEYWTMVFEPFLQDLQYRGTPNPDVFCNRWIKFDAALNRVRKVFGSEAIFVTGHHAQIEMRIASNADGLTLCHGRKDPVYLLREAVDKRKDQSYFLSCVPGEALRKVAFPVGCMEKSEVRRIAADNKLSTAYRKDSVGICFVGKRNFGSFLDGYIDMKPGRIVNVDDGKTIGVHQVRCSCKDVPPLSRWPLVDAHPFVLWVSVTSVVVCWFACCSLRSSYSLSQLVGDCSSVGDCNTGV